ncbi:MAG: MliC family protein [Acidobacteriaceae bacterium]|nr:MliC family protein [Acidobacteriaceae bacterium]MBV9442725.1 MliC family protein [Acidobacteriaceae bacterium]
MFPHCEGADSRHSFFGLKRILFAIALALSANTFTRAADLTIHLQGDAPVSRKNVTYQCDAAAQHVGLPTRPFTVEYINGGGNSLVTVPVSGETLVFANVISGSGARYVSKQYTWWEAKGSVTFYSDALSGKLQSECKVLESK